MSEVKIIVEHIPEMYTPEVFAQKMSEGYVRNLPYDARGLIAPLLHEGGCDFVFMYHTGNSHYNLQFSRVDPDSSQKVLLGLEEITEGLLETLSTQDSDTTPTIIVEAPAVALHPTLTADFIAEVVGNTLLQKFHSSYAGMSLLDQEELYARAN